MLIFALESFVSDQEKCFKLLLPSLCDCVPKAVEQDKYTLQKEVDLKTRILQSLQSDYDCVKNQQRQQLQEQESVERSRSTALNELNNKVHPPVTLGKAQC